MVKISWQGPRGDTLYLGVETPIQVYTTEFEGRPVRLEIVPEEERDSAIFEARLLVTGQSLTEGAIEGELNLQVFRGLEFRANKDPEFIHSKDSGRTYTVVDHEGPADLRRFVEDYGPVVRSHSELAQRLSSYL
jgi:hypothetical protein